MSKLFVVCVLFMSCLFSPHTQAKGGGSGVRNGGTGSLCYDGTLRLIDEFYAIRSAQSPLLLQERIAFFKTALARISHPNVRKAIRRSWDRNGNSERWADLALPVENTYYFTITEGWIPVGELFSAQGELPARRPSDSVCSFPIYDPDLCCEKKLLASFSPRSLKSRKNPVYFGQLTREQKNILELHEAVYISAREIARTSRMTRVEAETLHPSIRKYRTHPGYTGEVPAALVEMFVSAVLVDQDVDFHSRLLEAWAVGVHGKR